MEVTFIKKMIVPDEFNADAETYWDPISNYPTVFARVTQKPRPRGNEVVIGDRIVSVQVTIFTVRWRDDITVEHRVVFENIPYNIVHVVEGDSRREVLVITAEKIDNETWFAGSGFSLGFVRGFRA